MFRNQLITRYQIIPKSDFPSFKVHFSCEMDPTTGRSIDLQYKHPHFDRVPEGSGLFSVAARWMIKCNKEGNDRVRASVKYQVLCDETAFVGVIKQKDKVTGQMLQSSI